MTFGSNHNIETGENFGDDGHAYSIENVDKKEDKTLDVDVRNPWNNTESIPKTPKDISHDADTLEIITDDETVKEKAEGFRTDALKKKFKQKFNDENSTSDDLFVDERLDANNKKELVSYAGGMKNYIGKYLKKWKEEIDEMTADELKIVAKNTYQDTFGFSEKDAKDCAEHPEKLKQYCQQYGYQY